MPGRAFGAGASVAMLGASAICCRRARGRRSVCNAGRVVVTGGCGYVGSHTVLELLKAEYEALSPEFEIEPAPFYFVLLI